MNQNSVYLAASPRSVRLQGSDDWAWVGCGMRPLFKCLLRRFCCTLLSGQNERAGDRQQRIPLESGCPGRAGNREEESYGRAGWPCFSLGLGDLISTHSLPLPQTPVIQPHPRERPSQGLLPGVLLIRSGLARCSSVLPGKLLLTEPLKWDGGRRQTSLQAQ